MLLIVLNGIRLKEVLMEVLELIKFEDEEKVCFEKLFVLSDDFNLALISFLKKIQELMNLEEELIYRICDTEIDGKLAKNDVIEDCLIDARLDLIILENVLLEVIICKEHHNNSLDIFNLNVFWGAIRDLSIEEQLEKFQSWYKSEIKYFISRVEDIYIRTGSFVFVDNNKLSKEKNNSSIISREDVLLYKNRYCKNNSKIKVELNPSDFNIIIKKPGNKVIEQILFGMCNYLSLIYICDISEVKDNYFLYNIFGYRAIEKKISIKDMYTHNNCLIALYEWIYSSNSSISDKIGIVRNILSLNISKDGIDVFKESIISSCRSNYSIYLKENVEKYISVKNQQMFFLNSIIEDINNISSTYVKTFQNNIVAIITFFFTSIVFNVISTGKINNIFTIEISIISISVIIISFSYMVIRYIDSKNSLERIQEKYERNKKMYLDIIDKDDMERILDRDSYFIQEMNSNKDSLKRWRLFWIICNIILLVLVITLCCYNKYSMH